MAVWKWVFNKRNSPGIHQSIKSVTIDTNRHPSSAHGDHPLTVEPVDSGDEIGIFFPNYSQGRELSHYNNNGRKWLDSNPYSFVRWNTAYGQLIVTVTFYAPAKLACSRLSVVGGERIVFSSLARIFSPRPQLPRAWNRLQRSAPTFSY